MKTKPHALFQAWVFWRYEISDFAAVAGTSLRTLPRTRLKSLYYYSRGGGYGKLLSSLLGEALFVGPICPSKDSSRDYDSRFLSISHQRKHQ